MKQLSFGKTLIAFILILVGVLLILVNTGIISGEMLSVYEDYIPVLAVIFIGFWLIFRPLLSRRKSKWISGLFLLVYGGLLLCNDLGYLTFYWLSVWRLWPFLIIYIGVELLNNRAPSVRVRIKRDKEKAWKSKEKMHKHHFVSEASYKEPNWAVEPMSNHSKITDLKMDFTKAFVPDTETPVELSGWIGDIHLTLPEDLPFSLEATPSIGEVKIGGFKQANVGQGVKYKSNTFDEATRKISFNIDYHVLNLRVDRI